ncbi:MAG: alkaline phosphatase family protein [Candidatus Marinimicrobia bacterium]|nr:alkaline phosphatase family protein [Candidatus Neomarinimicrobiota bacterium]MCF7903595.1 alkaline phosphatase family protein [Candidatus Neomarinimicrobiota bacterium]
MLKKTAAIMTIVLLMSCGQGERSPRLVVFIVVDDLAHHTYTHYQALFTGGFKWLYDHGVSFDNAHLEHGYASTGPGHFVLGSSLHPGPAGLLANHFYDKRVGHDVYCIEDSSAHELDIPANSVSYKNVPGSTFGDWLKARSPESKVIGVGCKDRAAILLSGKNADLAVWYNWRGSFTTNDYYTETTPAWLHDFNREHNMVSYRDSLWTRSLPDAIYDQYAHADSFPGETDRYLTDTYSPVFPKGIESEWDDKKVFSEMGSRPWLDRMTLQLASKAIKEEGLGQDDVPDVLTLGLSVMDIIVHYYGPYSQETMDLLVKMDGYLQNFLDDLDDQIGLEHVVFALSTDHGSLPLPEHWTQVMGKTGGRINAVELNAARDKAMASILDMYGTHDFILRRGDTYFYDQNSMTSLGVEPARIDSIIRSNLESVEGIGRVYTKAELLDPDPEDRNAVRLSHMTHPELSPDIYTLLEKGWIYRGPYGTSHQTPYDYDSHIPLMFSSLGFTRTTLNDSVQMADVAITLADILNVNPPHKVDGKSLKSLLN